MGKSLAARYVLLAAVILVFAAAGRLLFVSKVIRSVGEDGIEHLHSDTREYVHLGENLYMRGTYTKQDTLRSRYRGVVRTPGLPVTWAAIRWAGGHFNELLYLNVVAGTAVCGLTMLLTWQALAHRGATLAAGAIAAISPTGIASAAIPLADLPFTLFFLSSFLLLYLSIRRGSLWRMALAGLCASIATMYKPTLLLWPFVLPLVCWLMARHASTRVRWGHVGVYLLLLIATLAGWAGRNYYVEGMATVSSVSTRNMRYIMLPYIETAARIGNWPSRRAVKEEYKKSFDLLDERILAQPPLTIREIDRREREDVRKTIGAHPFWTGVVFAGNLVNQNTRGWESAERQLPGDDRVSSALRSWITSTRHEAWGSLWVLLLLGGLWKHNRHAPRNYLMLAAFVAWAYVAFLLGTTRGEGSRLTYPVEAMALLAITSLIVPKSVSPNPTVNGTESIPSA